MQLEAYIFTILFLTVGPFKIIFPFAKLTQAMEPKFKRKIALMGIAIATGICFGIALLGNNLLNKYLISFAALEIAGGLVLLLSAMNAIFPRVEPPRPTPPKPTALNLAISPVATPLIVPPIGVAVILLVVMSASRYPGSEIALVKALVTILVLDFLVMFFADKILKIPGLVPLFQILASVLVFIQVALAVQAILNGIEDINFR
ncbi:MAG: hypothetical protein KME17_02175 [Cyanosarcina radialis HA8281-LM2]|jgi:multiple antibiotic resistance protein|nr:hypothetical protein [Cyanosarcina radialis HA8281-LM2]